MLPGCTTGKTIACALLVSYVCMLIACSSNTESSDNNSVPRQYSISTIENDSSLLLPARRWANNDPPKIVNLKAVENKEKITVTYDLIDTENDPIKISLWVEDTHGNKTFIDQTSASGDIGDQIKAGNSKKIVVLTPATTGEHITLSILAEDLIDPDFTQLIEAVNEDSLRKHLTNLARIRNFEADSIQMLSIRNDLKRNLSKVTSMLSSQSFHHNNTNGENLVGVRHGTITQAHSVLLGAHYDTSENTPGADDNASGVAAMLEIASLLNGYPSDKTIEFAAFDLEEAGAVGSYYYVQQYLKDTMSVFDGAYIIDMIGYCSYEPGSQEFPDELNLLFPEAFKKVESNQFAGDFMVCIANEQSKFLSDMVDESNGASLVKLMLKNGMEIPTLMRGDHASFWSRKIPAVFLGDGADTRNPNYNSSSDTSETIDFVFLVKNVKAILKAVAKATGIRHGTVTHYTLALKPKEK
jgi:hypothetical protein